MPNKNTPTFYKDGKRRVRCPECNSFLGSKTGDIVETRFTDDKVKHLVCKKCETKFDVFPPRRTINEKGEKGIAWGAGGSCWTGDMANDERLKNIKESDVFIKENGILKTNPKTDPEFDTENN